MKFHEIENSIQKEEMDYDDILRGNFEESFLNLTLKEKLWINWFTNYCRSDFVFKGRDPPTRTGPEPDQNQARTGPESTLAVRGSLFKGDDDIMVNPFMLQDLVSKIDPNQPSVYGSRLIHSPRIKNPRSKYFVDKSYWPEDYYPDYVSGGGFIITNSTIFAIAKGKSLCKTRGMTRVRNAENQFLTSK